MIKADALRLFCIVALAILIVRLVSLWFNNSPLFFDEAQYWTWAKEPAFGYFSKPPVLAWIIAFFTGICGDGEFCVRIASPLMHTATAFVLFATARLLFTNTIALVVGCGWLLLPAVSLSSTLVSTDVPLLFFWSSALYGFIRLERENSWKMALLVGVAFGLGLNAKYAMAYFFVCSLVYCLIPGHRPHLLLNSKYWASMLIGFVLLIPNILWNLENQFATVSHTGDNIGSGGGQLQFANFFEFVGSQFGIAGPIIFGVYLFGLFRLKKDKAIEHGALLISFSLPILVILCGQALFNRALANWAATAFPAIVLFSSAVMLKQLPQDWNRLSFSINGVVALIIAAIVLFALPGQLPIADKSNPFKRLWPGPQIAASMEELLEQDHYTHVLADRRDNSALLRYYLRDRDEKILAHRSGVVAHDHYQLTRAIQDLSDEALSSASILFVTLQKQVPESLLDRFTSEPLESGKLQNKPPRKNYRFYKLGLKQ